MTKIPYGRQHVTDEDINAVVEVLRSDFLTQGPRIREFEMKFADYIGCQYAVAVSSGTAALHLSALALKVNSSSRVITSPITFAATSNCIRYCGGQVDFADIDPETILLDIKAVRSKLESAPAGTYQGIIPIDLAGYPVNLEHFRELADEFGVWILEDACHAPGGWFMDSNGTKQYCGNGMFADLAIFSFHPVKHIATGEGGMITTNNKELFDHLTILRTHGITKRPDLLKENHGGWYYDMVDLGFNYRLTDIQCALGISQLRRVEANLTRRQELAKRYDRAFMGTSVQTIQPAASASHAYHLYVIQIQNRKQVYDHLKQHEIHAQVHYIPTHLLSYYRQFGWGPGDCPHAERYYSRCLSIPMYPGLTDEEQDFVIEKILEIVK